MDTFHCQGGGQAATACGPPKTAIRPWRPASSCGPGSRSRGWSSSWLRSPAFASRPSDFEGRSRRGLLPRPYRPFVDQWARKDQNRRSARRHLDRRGGIGRGTGVVGVRHDLVRADDRARLEVNPLQLCSFHGCDHRHRLRDDPQPYGGARGGLAASPDRRRRKPLDAFRPRFRRRGGPLGRPHGPASGGDKSAGDGLRAQTPARPRVPRSGDPAGQGAASLQSERSRQRRRADPDPWPPTQPRGAHGLPPGRARPGDS